MASVAETELEQKTAEYVHFVREYFAANDCARYVSKKMYLDLSEDGITLEVEGQ